MFSISETLPVKRLCHSMQYSCRPELILIDHGLYVDLPETFRHEYCMLWQSLFTGNVRPWH
jgi:predicted unusual protein kinase regulating ubiquinone biosynthesis (AarF/ABC1/UbiB family)